MELLTTRFGGGFGNPTTVSVACIGVLLAGFVGATSVSIGAQLETSFLKNGQVYSDVHLDTTSTPNKYKRLFNYANLDISYPVAALSEVLANRIVAASAERLFAVPCPHTDRDLRPCGKCYKCFRKLLLSGSGCPIPDSKTMMIIDKFPLKMASSAVYAAHKGGLQATYPQFRRYKDLDLSFLERYYDYALETLVPRGLRQHIRKRFSDFGFEPMTPDDELRLRSIEEHLARK